MLNQLFLIPRRLLVFLVLFSVVTSSHSEPQLDSWYTKPTGSYARLFESTATEDTKTSVTTWSRGQGVVTVPVYAGVHEINYSDDWIYIHTSGLGYHVMGPWYLNEAKTQDFPSFPGNTATTYRIPRTPTAFQGTTTTPPGTIGFYVDGVALFDATDTFSYINSSGADGSPTGGGRGDGVWNRDAWINEGVTFDSAFAHQAMDQHHYHANAVAVRHQLGDSVDYDEANNIYTENFNGEHSPILGWCEDGHPIYGPYGYSDPNDPNSTVKLMRSGFQKRDGTNGSTNLSSTGRTSLPQWVSTLEGRSTTIASNVNGPTVSAAYVLGHYLEDYTYMGDLGLQLGVDFDLDLYNGRFCVTPEFPAGVWAYFTSIEADGTPKYPYTIGRNFYGNPTGGVTTENEAVERYFIGGPNKQHLGKQVEIDSGEVTMVWDLVEGGKYRIETSTDFLDWDDSAPEFTAEGVTDIVLDANGVNEEERLFYRLARTGIEDYDTDGFSDEFGDAPDNGGGGGGGGGDLTVSPNSGAAGTSVTVQITVTATTPPPPPNFVAANPVTIGGYTARNVARNAGTGVITATVDLPANATPGALDVTVTFPPGPMGEPELVYSLTDGFTVTP